MAYIVNNLRLGELAAVARANKPFFDDFLAHLASIGYPTLATFVSEADEAKGKRAILSYLRKPQTAGVQLLDGVGAPYAPDKAKWLLLGWIFRDAPEQRLRPMISEMQGATTLEKQAELLNRVRIHVAAIFPTADAWTWNCFLDVMIDRLEGSRRAKKGNLFEVIVRRVLQRIFVANKLSLTVPETQIKLGGETYDVVVEGKKGKLLIPVKTRETMGGGHAHIFTRDIHKAIEEAVAAGYQCLPVIIAESWTGDLDGLASEDHIYLEMNPNQVPQIEPVLEAELIGRIPIFSRLQ